MQLTALKMKRLPVVAEPQFLGALTQLRYLLWDPALPADTRCEKPGGGMLVLPYAASERHAPLPCRPPVAACLVQPACLPRLPSRLQM